MQALNRQLDDTSLVVACLDGDEQAWEQLLNRYGRLIMTIPLRFGFEHPVAEEIFQEVCLVLLEKLNTLQDPTQFKPWLVTVTRRICLQRLREYKVQPVVETTEQVVLVDETPERLLLLLEQQEFVYRAFSTLDERCQHLLAALFVEQSIPSYETLAQELGLSVGSIGPTRSRCLEKLRQALVELGYHIVSESSKVTSA